MPLMNYEPIAKCRRCRGEGILAGPSGPRACRACNGVGLVADKPLRAKCGCGAMYDDCTWESLPYVGTMGDELETIELRNCDCGSTIAALDRSAA